MQTKGCDSDDKMFGSREDGQASKPSVATIENGEEQMAQLERSRRAQQEHEVMTRH